MLLRLRQKIPKTERNRGYFKALRGILLAQKSNNDRYVFLSNLNLKDQGELQQYRKEFMRQAKNQLHADYDRGYFAAWASYMRVLTKLEFTADKTKNESPDEKEVKAEAKVEKKVTEETKEKAQKKMKKAKTKEEAEEKSKTETEKKETKEEIKEKIEKIELEKAEKTERIEARQRTLFEYSK